MTQIFAYPVPFAAIPGGTGETPFQLWAPSVDAVTLEVDGEPPRPMEAKGDGWFASTAHAPDGTRYNYRLPDGLAVPDPRSRRQDHDVHGRSVVVDPTTYAWQNPEWTGRPWHEAVIYELHPGAMGGFNGIRDKLESLRDLGFTAIELMPISSFPGENNWGYDGVLPYAPDARYGTPDELKAMIDHAHSLGLMVFLDVVYNHFGPDGAYLHVYATEFFDEATHSPWGAAIDFHKRPVREFFTQNAIMWIMEYRFDGLRFDAVHAIYDDTYLPEMAAAIRAAAEPGRHVHLVMEHEGNRARLLGKSFDAQWTDDAHHALHVLLTGETEGYYEDFEEPARLLARMLGEGFAYQGEVSKHSGKPRGESSAHLPTTSFVIFLQNHDQIGNRAMGERLTVLADPEALKAATALLLLSPFIPLVFMGDEFGAREPFLFFTDHHDELAELVRNGRRKEFAHFAAFSDETRRDVIPDPNERATYEASVPRPEKGDPAVLELYRSLLAIRHRMIVPGIPGARSAGSEALGTTGVSARWTLGNGRTLAIAANFGADPVTLGKLPNGEILFESRPGDVDTAHGGTLPARSAVVLLTGGG